MNADPKIIAAVIGMTGIVLGAGITAMASIFKEDIRILLRRTKRPDKLSGHWSCEWQFVNPGPNNPKVIADVVELKALTDGDLKGEGSNSSAGKYEIVGKYTVSAVSLIWRNKDELRDLTGVAQLRRMPNGRLEGFWCQIDDDGATIKGDVKLHKISSV